MQRPGGEFSMSSMWCSPVESFAEKIKQAQQMKTCSVTNHQETEFRHVVKKERTALQVFLESRKGSVEAEVFL